MTQRRSHLISVALSRRRFIKLGALLTAMHLKPLAWGKARSESERRVSFYQTHTGEALDTVYWAQGQYLPGALSEINYLLRDHRSGEVRAIDIGLLDLLNRIAGGLEANQPFHVISGYRSPKTNEMLAARSRGVATHSLHMDGMAIDIRVPGRDLRSLRDYAMSLKGGGVGYYPSAEFVHLDVGRVRSW